MPDLVPIPYQPTLYVAPSFLARLLRACALAGHDIPLNGSDAAWRPYAWQAHLYDLYLHHGGEIASNPDTGQRAHMRGAAGDILNRADRPAMLAAGFLPDPDEWWHFNDPNWSNMPIIKTNTTPAATHAAVLEEEEEDMSLKVIRAANGSIALVGERYFGEFTAADKDGVDAAVQTFGPVVPVTNAQYATTKERAKGRFAELVNAISAAVKAP